MKGSYVWKLMYLCCALTGCLAGYGIFRLADGADMTKQYATKDNTLVRESDESVFFSEEPIETVIPTVPMTVPESEPVEDKSLLSDITATPEPVAPEKPLTEQAVAGNPQKEPAETLVPENTVTPTMLPQPEQPLSASGGMPSLGTQWAGNFPAAIPTPLPIHKADSKETETAEVITYPAKIFGQVPVINRSDAYVSYFEFAYDLIALAEPKVEQQGRSMAGMLTEFVIKALFYGVDIEKLDINAPIPRRQAAMALWLAARILDEPGNGTSAKSAQKYVTDLKGCSSAEKKAVAYLYEQGILKGYQVSGQQFYPNADLETEDGTAWLSGIKQCWK